MEIDEDEEMRSPSPLEVKRESKEKNEPIHPIDPVEPVDAPRDMAVSQKRPRWAQQALQDAEGHEAPHEIHQESKRPQRFSNYVALMSHVIDSEPTMYEETSRHQVWKDAMTKDFQPIMKNDV